jgi:hypothetical protein
LNHWYALGAAMAGHPEKAAHVAVLAELQRLVVDGLAEFPLSWVHYMELAENPRDELRNEAARAMATLSRFRTMAPLSPIICEELDLSFNARFGRPAFPKKVQKFDFGVGFAFNEPVPYSLPGGADDQLRDFERILGMPVTEWEARINPWMEFNVLAQPPRAMAEQIQGYYPYAARAQADEDLASFNVMIQTLRTDPDIRRRPLDAIAARQFIFDFPDQYAAACIGAGFTNDREPFHDAEALTGFLMSLPSRHVAAMIQWHYLKDLARDWTINDLRDIAALSAAIPYCDIVVTDKKAWDAVVNRAHLDTKFRTPVLPRLDGLADLIAHQPVD